MAPLSPTAAAIRRARARFDAGEPVSVIARGFGVTDTTFRRWRRAWGWPARPDRPVRDTGAPEPPAAQADARPEPRAAPDTNGLFEAVRRAVQGELLALGAGDGPPLGSEARSRALATLTRTLGILRALETQGAGAGVDAINNDDRPPVDIAELRHELARRLHKLSEGGDDP